LSKCTQFTDASKSGHLNHPFVHAGNLSSSGRQQLASTNADAFSRGSTDGFDLRLRHMGQLQELHIWHNGTGLATAWHLSLIVVADETNGERYCAQNIHCNFELSSSAKTGPQTGNYSGLYMSDPRARHVLHE